MSNAQSRDRLIRQIYNSMAETYDSIETESFYANQYEVYERHMTRYLPLLTGEVLDLGCGTGIQTAYLAKHSKHVTGIDISTLLLKKAADRCARFKNVTVLEADATSLPFPDAHFDAVISYGETISHIDDYQRAFSEAVRVLRPQGTFIFSVLNKWNIGLIYSPVELIQALVNPKGQRRIWRCEDDQGNPTHLKLKTFTQKEIRDIVSNLGFAVLESEGFHISSLLVPLSWQKQASSFWGRVFRQLGALDAKIARTRFWSKFGYSCIYTAQRR